MTGGRASRAKGDRIERELVALNKAIGIHCERYPLSGASRFRGTGHDLDVYVLSKKCAPLVAEAKGRKNGAGFTTFLEKWLADHDLLFLRRDHADPLVVLPWSVWARILERCANEKIRGEGTGDGEVMTIFDADGLGEFVEIEFQFLQANSQTHIVNYDDIFTVSEAIKKRFATSSLSASSPAPRFTVCEPDQSIRKL